MLIKKVQKLMATMANIRPNYTNFYKLQAFLKVYICIVIDFKIYKVII